MPKLSWAFTALAVSLLGLVGVSTWLPVNWRLLLLAGLVGAVCLILAGVNWMLEGPMRDRVVRHLADTVVASRPAAIRRAALAVTVPLRVVR